MDSDKYTQGLNGPQREAVLYCDGPSLVIAGAGSGKTRVLTHKIAYLLAQGIQPHKIMALTFTNKAAKEMKERIDKLLGYEASRPLWMGTFHSIFCRILHIEAAKIGFADNFTVYKPDDTQSLIKDIIKAMNLDKETYKVKNICTRISACKNHLILPDSYLANAAYIADDRKSRIPEFGNIYKQYKVQCQRANAMDFDDMLVYTNILFKVHPDVLEKYQDMIDYILVDEYQDTNFAQYLIIKRLAEKKQKLFVVGDDAQSIYSFRGAEIRNILNFKNDYPNCRLIKLEQNYRSTQNIVDAANSVINKNANQIHKKVFSENAVGEKLQISQSVSNQTEGILIANSIKDIINTDKADYSDFAILYRTRSQSQSLESALQGAGIPYKVVGDTSFYDRAEIRDMLAYIRLIINHNDMEAFKRIVNYPSRKIGDTTIERILAAVESLKLPLWEIVSKPYLYLKDVNAATRLRIKDFATLIDQFTEQINGIDAYNFTLDIYRKTGIESDLRTLKKEEDGSRADNVEELLNSIKTFCDARIEIGESDDIGSYLENVSLLTDQNDGNKEDPNKVSLMTIHAAKGLEFDNVYIAGVEENLFPLTQSVLSVSELEEERRLFYVAITRAKTRAMLSYVQNRMRHGKNEVMAPSRFLKEIDKQYVDWHGLPMAPDFLSFESEFDSYSDFKRKQTYSPQSQYSRPSNFGGNNQQTNFQPKATPAKHLTPIDKAAEKSITVVANHSELVAGKRVRHTTFGDGIIDARIGEGADTKLIIKFDTGTERTLLLKFAKLQILN
ncbi:MAG: UvrD-helicase domain-containing protein [Bacteroidales bacterium]|nr:UvrD-helicase domain-containing protein [Bacteroidales bacterium]